MEIDPLIVKFLKENKFPNLLENKFFEGLSFEDFLFFENEEELKDLTSPFIVKKRLIQTIKNQKQNNFSSKKSEEISKYGKLSNNF